MIDCGNAFLIEDEDGYNCHLCIVITPPNCGEVVIVSVTTERARSEMLVRLNKGDHPWLEHPSVISYAYSRVTTVEEIDEPLRMGQRFLALMRRPNSSSALNLVLLNRTERRDG